MKHSRIAVMASLFAASVLAGCLTSGNQFYNDSDIVSDPGFIGNFGCEGTGLEVSITAGQPSSRSYLLRLSEGGGTSDYQATLFKIDGSEFIDLFPISEKNLSKTYREGYPTTSGLLNLYSHEWSSQTDAGVPTSKLHLVLRVQITKNGIVCFAPNKFDPHHSPIANLKELKFHVNGEGVVVDSATANLRALLKSYSGSNWGQLFAEQTIDGGGYTLARK